MRRAGRDAAGPAIVLPAEGAAVRVVEETLIVWARLIWMVAEHIVEPAQPGAQALFRRLEHMFVSLRRGSDGMGSRAASFVASGGGPQGGPDLQLVPNAIDHVIRELSCPGVAAQVGRLDAGADRLERRFIDRSGRPFCLLSGGF